MPSSFAPRWSRILFSRQVTAIAGSLVVLTFLGCMSLTFQGRTVSVENGTCPEVICEKGKVHIAANCIADVYYPHAFSTRPNLEFDDHHDCCELIEQREDGFRVRNQSSFGVTMTWKARGVHTETPSPVVGPPLVVATPATGTVPPPEPVPATLPKPLPANP
jgi:hypothetical protein